MSGDNKAEATVCCASCCIAEIDDIKLKECDGCDLVRYCSDECQQLHRSDHEEACKERAAQLRDELLFKQPECSCLGDCPICSLPLSLDKTKSSLYNCCCKVICNGCDYASWMREIEMRRGSMCAFCRKTVAKTEEEMQKQRMKRVEANDPYALFQEGSEQYMKGEYSSAFEYFTRAVTLGDATSHYRLALMYQLGKGVEKDEGKYIHHFEEAAIGGHPGARYNLGVQELHNANYERAAKHFIIAATQGHDLSIKALMTGFKNGRLVSKEELSAALRAHKAAVDATKSPQREAGEVFFRRMGW